MSRPPGGWVSGLDFVTVDSRACSVGRWHERIKWILSLGKTSAVTSGPTNAGSNQHSTKMSVGHRLMGACPNVISVHQPMQQRSQLPKRVVTAF
jgi:hypothetical protein